MNDVTIRVTGNQSLSDFERLVQQEEGAHGFLKALGKDGKQNTITINLKRPPTNRAKLETLNGDAPQARVGHSVVCTGDCLVDGRMVKVVAYSQI